MRPSQSGILDKIPGGTGVGKIIAVSFSFLEHFPRLCCARARETLSLCGSAPVFTFLISLREKHFLLSANSRHVSAAEGVMREGKAVELWSWRRVFGEHTNRLSHILQLSRSQ